jgi:hypothetical protein
MSRCQWNMWGHVHSRACILSYLLLACSMAFVGVSEQSAAQQLHPASMLDGRVSAALRTQVMQVVDSTVAKGLPGAPLIDKTLEGVSKGADNRRILAAVRAVAAALGTARQALGTTSSDELTAAAAALRGGVPPTALSDMRHALPGRSLVVPLSVLGALVAQGTPPAPATAAVVAYAKRNDDPHVLDFGRDVAREIAAGLAPQAAVSIAAAGGSPGGGSPPPVPSTLGGGSSGGGGGVGPASSIVKP